MAGVTKPRLQDPTVKWPEQPANDFDSPVSLDYYDRAPSTFNGTIGTAVVKDLKN